MNIKDAIFGAQSLQKLAAASDDLQAVCQSQTLTAALSTQGTAVLSGCLKCCR